MIWANGLLLLCPCLFSTNGLGVYDWMAQVIVWYLQFLDRELDDVDEDLDYRALQNGFVSFLIFLFVSGNFYRVGIRFRSDYNDNYWILVVLHALTFTGWTFCLNSVG